MLLWWLATASVLVAVIVAVVGGPGPLDDPNPGDQRAGFLFDPGEAPVVQGLQLPGRPLGERPVFLLFDRRGYDADRVALVLAEVPKRFAFFVVVPQAPGAGPQSGRVRVISDPRQRLAEAVELSEPVAGGFPIGYALIDGERRVLRDARPHLRRARLRGRHRRGAGQVSGWARAYRPLRLRTLGLQLAVLVVAEVLLFASYRGHEASFHWATPPRGDDRVGGRQPRGPGAQGRAGAPAAAGLLAWHLFAMFPTCCSAPRRFRTTTGWTSSWRTSSSHYMPGGAYTWLVLALVASALYVIVLAGWSGRAARRGRRRWRRASAWAAAISSARSGRRPPSRWLTCASALIVLPMSSCCTDWGRPAPSGGPSPSSSRPAATACWCPPRFRQVPRHRHDVRPRRPRRRGRAAARRDGRRAAGRRRSLRLRGGGRAGRPARGPRPDARAGLAARLP